MAKGNPPKKEGFWQKRHYHSQACFESTLNCDKNHDHDDAKCFKQKKLCPFEQGQRI